MKFMYTDLGPRQLGEVVEVTLTAVANVRLMDTLNFTNYKNGMKHIYTGGVVRSRTSTVPLKSPPATNSLNPVRGDENSVDSTFTKLTVTIGNIWALYKIPTLKKKEQYLGKIHLLLHL